MVKHLQNNAHHFEIMYYCQDTQASCKIDFLPTIQFYKYGEKVTVNLYEPRHDRTNKMSVRPAKTQISLGIQSDQSLRCPHEESLCP